VYDEPATTFVASFVGAPPMNLVPASAATREGTVHLSGDGIDFPLFDGALASRQVVVGMRPEHLKIARGGGAHLVDGRVLALENLGSVEVAFISRGGERIAWRGVRPLGVRVGERVQLTIDPGNVVLFDPTSTRRLVWVDDDPTRPSGRRDHEHVRAHADSQVFP
jgi:multiple sugar transport system ATP-binding protein